MAESLERLEYQAAPIFVPFHFRLVPSDELAEVRKGEKSDWARIVPLVSLAK